MFWGTPGLSSSSPMPLPRGFCAGGLRGPHLLPGRPAIPWRPLHQTWAQGGDGCRVAPAGAPHPLPLPPVLRPVPRLTAPAAAARVQSASDARVRALDFFGSMLQEFDGLYRCHGGAFQCSVRVPCCHVRQPQDGDLDKACGDFALVPFLVPHFGLRLRRRVLRADCLLLCQVPDR